MKHYENTAAKAASESGHCAYTPAFQPVRSASQDDAAAEYSTIDGEVINSSAGTDAVKKGNGLFIGDYFVGILDSITSMGNKPYLRY